jgi:hypothetical protein
MWVVGQRLAERFPMDAAWDAELDSLADSEDLQALAEVARDIRGLVKDPSDPEQVAAVVTQHYDRALECVELVAERLGLEPRELLLTLTVD